MRQSYRALKLVLIPLALNMARWQLVFIPRQAVLREWQQTRNWVEIKPKIESLLSESRAVKDSWESTRFSQNDLSAATEALQQHVQRYDLQIQKLQMQEASPKKDSNFSSVTIVLELTGSFSSMIRWISDLETLYGFRIDSLQINGSSFSDKPAQMTVEVTALLTAAPAPPPAPSQATADLIEQTVQKFSRAMKSYRDQDPAQNQKEGVFLRDPLQALVDSKGQPIVLLVAREGTGIQGVIWSDAHPLVASGGRLFSKGDFMGSRKIIEIYPDRVVVQKEDGEETIFLDRWTE